MSNIQIFLEKILLARYGKDVRQAIHDGIKQCYEDCATEEQIQQIKKHINDNTVHTTKEEKNSWNKTAIDLKGVAGLVNIVKESVDNLSKEIVDLKENGTGTSTQTVVNQYYEGVEVTAETEDEQKVIDAYKNMMSECMGDYDKIPFLLQTDNHNYFPKSIYELCGKMMNFAQFSKVITLGDTVSNYYTEKHLQNFVDAMKPFPIEKKITVAGNHDVWVGATDRSYIDQSKLSTYLKNYTLKRKDKNGYGVVIDDYFNVKYLLISNYDKEEGEGGTFVSTKQVEFIIEELSKNDGYDIVILTHEPIVILDNTATSLLEAGVYTTVGNNNTFVATRSGFTKLIVDRKTKGSGTYTDDEGVEHAYDFTNCNSELLCSFCGHTHVEAFDFISSELLIVSFGGAYHADGKPIYFGYIDRKKRLLKYYRVAGDYSSTITVGLDKVSATNMTLDNTEISMDIGSLGVISPMFTPLTSGNQRITWSSDNESVATVKKGFVTAVSTGTATITAVSEDGNFTATCSVTVSEKEVATLTSISATYNGGSVDVGTEVDALTGIVVTAKYSDGSTATVTDYTLSGTIAEGLNTITVTYKDMTTTITVIGVAEGEEEITLSTISATYSGGSVPVGTSLNDLTGLTVTGTYSDGSTANITGYTLSGEIVEGSNTITVSYDGKATTFTVTGMAKATNNLPSEYQEVEYLEGVSYGSGSVQPISTLQSGDKGYITASWSAPTQSIEHAICGTQSNGKCEIWVNGGTFNCTGYTNLVSPAKGTTCEASLVYDIEFDITGNISNISLMAYYTTSAPHKYGLLGKMYSAKFYRGETLIYNFVPCYRKTDNVIGVYDTVNNVFTESTGTLSKGADV